MAGRAEPHPDAELLPELSIRVRWPELCARCGEGPAPKRRSFQFLHEHAGAVHPVTISVPLCLRCYRDFASIKGWLSRFFPQWHGIGEISRGSPIFHNKRFDREFLKLNPHLEVDREELLEPGEF